MIKRIPVTQEYLGDALAAQARGELVTHPCLINFSNALYDGINKLVHKISHKYKGSINEREDELSQNCFYHLWKRMGKFDSSRGRFTTFAHWVCSNNMRSYYVKNKATKEHYVEAHEDSENQEGSELTCEFNKNMHVSDALLNAEISDAVRELILKYPSKRELTISILGDPEDLAKRKFSDEIRLSKVKGFGRKEKEKFYNQTIVPFFRVKFGGLYV